MVNMILRIIFFTILLISFNQVSSFPKTGLSSVLSILDDNGDDDNNNDNSNNNNENNNLLSEEKNNGNILSTDDFPINHALYQEQISLVGNQTDFSPLHSSLPPSSLDLEKDAEGEEYKKPQQVVAVANFDKKGITRSSDSTLISLKIVPVFSLGNSQYFGDENPTNPFFDPKNANMCKDLPLKCPVLVYPSRLNVLDQYLGVIPAPFQQVRVIAVPACSHALLTLGGRVIKAEEPSYALDLPRSLNLIDLVVTAQDLKTISTYRLRFQREIGDTLGSPLTLDEDQKKFTLDSIRITGCWKDEPVTPVFVSSTSTWDFDVDRGIKEFLEKEKVITTKKLIEKSFVKIEVEISEKMKRYGGKITLKIFKGEKKLLSSACSDAVGPPCLADKTGNKKRNALAGIDDSTKQKKSTEDTQKKVDFKIKLPSMQSETLIHIISTSGDQRVRLTYALLLKRSLDTARTETTTTLPLDCSKLNDCSLHGECIEAEEESNPQIKTSVCDCEEGYISDDCSLFIANRKWLNLRTKDYRKTTNDLDSPYKFVDSPYLIDASGQVNLNSTSSTEDFNLKECLADLYSTESSQGLPKSCFFARDQCQRLHKEVYGGIDDGKIDTIAKHCTNQLFACRENSQKIDETSVDSKTHQAKAFTYDQDIFNDCFFKTAIPMNEEAKLEEIDICPGSIDEGGYLENFSEIRATVPTDIYKVTVKVRASPRSIIKISNQEIANEANQMSESSPIFVLPGPNKIPIEITSENLKETSSYTLIVKRLYAEIALPVTESSIRLRYLECWAGLIPAFSPDILFYKTNEISFGVKSTVVKAVPEEELSYLSIDGSAVRNGALSPPIAINAGTTKIEVVVTASDGVTTGTYTISVRRSFNGKGTGVEARLSSLVISEKQPLRPPFDSNIYSYKVSVPHGISSIYVQAKVVPQPFTGDGSQYKASIAIQGTNEPDGARSRKLDLLPGKNKIEVVVTATDRQTTKTYTLTVIRAYPKTKSTDSPIAKLVSLKPHPSIQLEPPFDPNVVEYVMSIPEAGTKFVSFEAESLQGGYIEIDGSAIGSKKQSQAIFLKVKKEEKEKEKENEVKTLEQQTEQQQKIKPQKETQQQQSTEVPQKKNQLTKKNNKAPDEDELVTVVIIRVTSQNLRNFLDYKIRIGQGSPQAILHSLIPSFGILFPKFDSSEESYSLLSRVKGQTTVRFKPSTLDPGSELIYVAGQEVADGAYSPEVK